MGYSSTVAIAYNKKVKTDLLLEVLELPPLLKECDDTHENDTGTYHFFSSIKWYEEYKDVTEVKDFLDKIENLYPEDPGAYGFIRTGEETWDVDERGQPWDFDLYAETIITSPFD